MAENNNEEWLETVVGTISDLSDIDMVINYCLQNKIAKLAIDELLKLGFTSLKALQLVEMGDLMGSKIPKGQHCLILHIAAVLKETVNTPRNQSGGKQTGWNSRRTNGYGNTQCQPIDDQGSTGCGSSSIGDYSRCYEYRCYEYRLAPTI